MSIGSKPQKKPVRIGLRLYEGSAIDQQIIAWLKKMPQSSSGRKYGLSVILEHVLLEASKRYESPLAVLHGEQSLLTNVQPDQNQAKLLEAAVSSKDEPPAAENRTKTPSARYKEFLKNITFD